MTTSTAIRADGSVIFYVGEAEPLRQRQSAFVVRYTVEDRPVFLVSGTRMEAMHGRVSFDVGTSSTERERGGNYFPGVQLAGQINLSGEGEWAVRCAGPYSVVARGHVGMAWLDGDHVRFHVSTKSLNVQDGAGAAWLSARGQSSGFEDLQYHPGSLRLRDARGQWYELWVSSTGGLRLRRTRSEFVGVTVNNERTDGVEIGRVGNESEAGVEFAVTNEEDWYQPFYRRAPPRRVP